MPRLYSPLQVACGSFFGGPLATMCLVSANFYALGQRRNAILAALGSFAFGGTWVLVFFQSPRIGVVAPAMLEAVAAHAIARRLQVPRNGDEIHSNQRVIAITLFAIVLSVLFLVGVMIAMIASSGFRT